ncbi:MAG: aminotransferase class I/II-fold pyridoxal phosphate-dependent enzyme [Pseudomonadota bacterium]|nr:aminotransferase class I/II-fold pyridoxal phosphate-dependent enzyme [Pseudomonadota bacterium]
MTLKLSKRGKIPPFIVMDVMRNANKIESDGRNVIHLEVGQPGTPAPKKVLDAVQDAMKEEKIGYTDALGLIALKERIVLHYEEFYGINVAQSQVVLTTGSSGGFILAFLSAFDPGDRVAVASPGYPAYRNILNSLGVEVVNIQTGFETNFQPDPELLDEAAFSGTLDGLIVASPSNPTGTMINSTAFKNLVDYCQEKDIRLISDEIYHGITYDKPAETVLHYTNDAIVINSFSKYFSMTGWRLGWMVVPENLLRSIECLAQNLFISPPTLSQFAAIKVFDCQKELKNYVGRYADNRQILLTELPNVGFETFAPVDGAFYIYADIRNLTNDSQEFCRRMLAEIGIAATPGIDFDPLRGNSYMRFSFAGDTNSINLAIERLRLWNK